MIADQSPEVLSKARRNSLAISTLLFVLFFGKSSFTPTASYLGLGISFGDPFAIYTVLWFIWAYFFFRYSQLLLSTYRANVREHFVKILDAVCSQKLEKIAKETLEKNGVSIKEIRFNGERLRISVSTWESIWEREFKGMYQESGPTPASYSEFTLSLFWLRFIPEIAISIYKFLFIDTALLEYVFPLFLGNTMLLSSLWWDWDGSIPSLYLHYFVV